MKIDINKFKDIVDSLETVGGCPKASNKFTPDTKGISFTDEYTNEEAFIFYLKNENLDIRSSIIFLETGLIIITLGDRVYHFNVPQDITVTEEAIQEYLDDIYIQATDSFYKWLTEKTVGSGDENKLPGIYESISTFGYVGQFKIESTDLNVQQTKTIMISLPVGYEISIKYKTHVEEEELKHTVDTALLDNEGNAVKKILQADITTNGRSTLLHVLGEIVKPIEL